MSTTSKQTKLLGPRFGFRFDRFRPAGLMNAIAALLTWLALAGRIAAERRSDGRPHARRYWRLPGPGDGGGVTPALGYGLGSGLVFLERHPG